MNEDNAVELKIVIGRLENGLRELDVRPSEITAILGIADGEWPIAVAQQWSPMTAILETRLRHLEELCRLAIAVFDEHAGEWLRGKGVVGMSPLVFLISNADALHALRSVLKERIGVL